MLEADGYRAKPEAIMPYGIIVSMQARLYRVTGAGRDRRRDFVRVGARALTTG